MLRSVSTLSLVAVGALLAPPACAMVMIITPPGTQVMVETLRIPAMQVMHYSDDERHGERRDRAREDYRRDDHEREDYRREDHDHEKYDNRDHYRRNYNYRQVNYYSRPDDYRHYCHYNNGTGGMLIGAGAGALLGSSIVDDNNRSAGALLGGLTGGLIGRSMSRGVRDCY